MPYVDHDLVVIATTIAGLVLGLPIVRAIVRRIDRKGVAAGSDERIEALLEVVSDLRDRVSELEERQDFAERVLSRQREPQALPGEAVHG